MQGVCVCVCVCVCVDVVTPLHVTCTNNDGMEKPQPELGCCFQGGRENEGCRSQAPPPLLFLPPSAPSSSTSPPALSNLGWGCVFTRHQGFRGWFELLKGKKGRDGELRGVGGHKQRQLT